MKRTEKIKKLSSDERPSVRKMVLQSEITNIGLLYEIVSRLTPKVEKNL